MQRKCSKRMLGILLSAAMVMALMSPAVGSIRAMPENIRLSEGDARQMEFVLPGSATVEQDCETVCVESGSGSVTVTARAEEGQATLVYKLLGMFRLKTVSVTVEPERRLIPGGQSIGVALLTDGVVVVGASDVSGAASPARAAGLRPGDRILSVNGEKVQNAAHLTQLTQQGAPMEVLVEREGETAAYTISPVYDAENEVYRLGAWVRDSTAGLGTLTYFDPENGRYGALGHAITDVDTSIVLPIEQGAIYESNVIDIHRGTSGTPGELMGSFFGAETEMGSLETNTEFGIFGEMYAPIENPLYPDGLPAATRTEVQEGPAEILTTLDDGELRAYDCEITRLYDQYQPSTRSMVLQITDPELLDATGGIVQGMSGSPIVQNGKLIGAVTHVFVNDPTQGYGIYLDWMLEAEKE